MTSAAGDNGHAAGHVFAQGSVIDLAAVPESERKRAFDEAFEYRGDITLMLTDGSRVDCYLFDRRPGATLADSLVRVMESGGGEKRSISYSQIARLEFTGKDTAAGKTWENWVRRYVEKRLAGEQANIESEVLD
ncbi:MAG: hypothetical protein NT059_10260 [Planctomycetota bacterium]|nr:hypothetical protein [Planctomycetota bacterium]